MAVTRPDTQKEGFPINSLRPIMLIDVLRKLWTTLMVNQATSSLLHHNVLSASHHAFLTSRGTNTANIQVINALGTAFDQRKSFYEFSWDIQKAFDSVSKPLIRLAWRRLTTPPDFAEWLVQLMCTGQGNVCSPLSLLAVFDILPTALSRDPCSKTFQRINSSGKCYATADVYFADDLKSFASSQLGLQREVYIVSGFTILCGMSIVRHKLFRLYHVQGLERNHQIPCSTLYTTFTLLAGCHRLPSHRVCLAN